MDELYCVLLGGMPDGRRQHWRPPLVAYIGKIE